MKRLKIFCNRFFHTAVIVFFTIVLIGYTPLAWFGMIPPSVLVLLIGMFASLINSFIPDPFE